MYNCKIDYILYIFSNFLSISVIFWANVVAANCACVVKNNATYKLISLIHRSSIIGHFAELRTQKVRTRANEDYYLVKDIVTGENSPDCVARESFVTILCCSKYEERERETADQYAQTHARSFFGTITLVRPVRRALLHFSRESGNNYCKITGSCKVRNVVVDRQPPHSLSAW